jgi:hypothetical protein
MVDAGWVFVEEKDVSWEHCGRPAFWEGESVVCGKCLASLFD